MALACPWESLRGRQCLPMRGRLCRQQWRKGQEFDPPWQARVHWWISPSEWNRLMRSLHGNTARFSAEALDGIALLRRGQAEPDCWHSPRSDEALVDELVFLSPSPSASCAPIGSDTVASDTGDHLGVEPALATCVAALCICCNNGFVGTRTEADVLVDDLPRELQCKLCNETFEINISICELCGSVVCVGCENFWKSVSGMHEIVNGQPIVRPITSPAWAPSLRKPLDEPPAEAFFCAARRFIATGSEKCAVCDASLAAGHHGRVCGRCNAHYCSRECCHLGRCIGEPTSKGQATRLAFGVGIDQTPGPEHEAAPASAAEASSAQLATCGVGVDSSLTRGAYADVATAPRDELSDGDRYGGNLAQSVGSSYGLALAPPPRLATPDPFEMDEAVLQTLPVSHISLDCPSRVSHCGRCGTDYKPDSAFCRNCGGRRPGASPTYVSHAARAAVNINTSVGVGVEHDAPANSEPGGQAVGGSLDSSQLVTFLSPSPVAPTAQLHEDTLNTSFAESQQPGGDVSGVAPAPTAVVSSIRIPIAQAGTSTAALDLLRMAQKVHQATSLHAAEVVLERCSWATVINPLLWQASDADDCGSVVDWLGEVTRDCTQPLEIGSSSHVGAAAVQAVWCALRGNLRERGVLDRSSFAAWHSSYGLGEVRINGQMSVRNLGPILAALDAPVKAMLSLVCRHLATKPLAIARALRLYEQFRVRGLGRPAQSAPADFHTLEFDGGASPNPGLGSCGAVLFAPANSGGDVLWAGSFLLGSPITSMEAEYHGPSRGLSAALSLTDIVGIHVRGDSKVVVSQMLGRHAVVEPRLRVLHSELTSAVLALRERSIDITWQHWARRHNWRADGLARLARTRASLNDQTDSYGWADEAQALLASLPLDASRLRHGGHGAISVGDERSHHLEAEGSIQRAGMFVGVGEDVSVQRASDVVVDSADWAKPVIPLPSAPTGANDWTAIDHIDVFDCFVSPFRQLDDIPTQFIESWALANVEVHEQYFDAPNDESRIRALKWILALHQILLRAPLRGGRRGHNDVPKRFQAWADGDLAYLVQKWMADRSFVARSRRSSHAASVAASLEQALSLIQRGELSRAQRLIESKGMGNLADAAVVEQLAGKHPLRKQALPDQLDAGALARYNPLTVHLEDKYRQLGRLAGSGPSGYRNEYLIALARAFSDERAQRAVPLHERFAEEYVNARLPAWFCYIWASVRLVAPIKKWLDSSRVPDVRPVGIGEPRRVACVSHVFDTWKSRLAARLWPQQVAIGVNSGVHLLAVGLRAALEIRPRWIILKLDFVNAFNEMTRASVIKVVDAGFDEEFVDLQPMLRTQLDFKSPIFLGDRRKSRAPFDSEDGMQQGSGEGPPAFCLGIHPDLVEADTAMAQYGGCAKADMDDVYLFGPIEHVLRVGLVFTDALEERTGIKLNLGKSAIHSIDPARDAAFLADNRRYSETFKVGCLDGIRPGSSHYGEGFGILISGVPVGDHVFVKTHIDAKVDTALEHIQKTTKALRSAHQQSLWTQITRCLRPKLDFLAQTCYPVSCSSGLQRFDEALLVAAEAAAHQPLTQIDSCRAQRLRLPARLYGCGLRSSVATAPAAFVGTICRCAPMMIDRSIGGVVEQGFLTSPLADLLGVGSFDEGWESLRFDTLLRGSSSLGAEFARCWQCLVAAATRLPGQLLDDGALAVPVSAAGTEHSKPLKHPQRAFTEQIELACYDRLDIAFKNLPVGDAARTVWLNLDRFSTQWVTALPSSHLGLMLGNDVFSEIFATYLALPSPTCAPMVGQPIGRFRETLDAYGLKLTTLPLPGDGWRLRHDTVKHLINKDVSQHGQPCLCEVFGLFAPLLPQHGRDAVMAMPRRKRQGLVPDFLIGVPGGGDVLMELKVISGGQSRYGGGHVARCHAVAERAREIPAEYATKAKELDHRFCGTAPGAYGPISHKLASYGRVHGLVFGAFGEASADVHALLKVVADECSSREWVAMGARDPDDAKTSISSALYRSWGVAAVRAQARLKLRGLSSVGPGANAARTRRQASAAFHERIREAESARLAVRR